MTYSQYSQLYLCIKIYVNVKIVDIWRIKYDDSLKIHKLRLIVTKFLTVFHRYSHLKMGHYEDVHKRYYFVHI